MKYQPTRDKVIVLTIPDEERKTVSGIVVVEQGLSESSYVMATVLAVGPGGISDEGSTIPMQVSVSDVVMVRRFAGSLLDPEVVGFDRPLVTGEELRILIEDDIEAVVDNLGGITAAAAPTDKTK